MRAGHVPRGAPLQKQWFGTITSTSAGRHGRNLVVYVKYTADPFGPLRGDDNSIVTEKGTLPVRQGELVDVLAVEVIASIPAPQGDSDSDDDDADEAATVPAVKGSDGQIDNYPVVPDVDEEVDYALWPELPVLGRSPGDHAGSLTGKFFLDLELCSLDVARSKTPQISWAAVTAPVRKAHIADLELFRNFLAARQKSLHLPLDVLLAHHLQKLRVNRKWAWSTVSRHASGLVGAFASLPIYTKGGPSVGLANLPHFKGLLKSASRLGAAVGPREPAPAVFADIAAALRHLRSDKAKAVLLLCWYAPGRVTSCSSGRSTWFFRRRPSLSRQRARSN